MPPARIRASAACKGRPYRDRRATHDAHCNHAKMPVDLQEIKRIIEDNQDFLWRAWKKEQSKRANR